MFPPNADPAYRRHFSENIKHHLPLPMIGNEFVKVYTRCRYWPRCSNRKCKFVHPVYDCKFDKDCPYDTLCAFRHSSDPVPENLTGYHRGRRKSKVTAFGPNGKLPSSNDECINGHTELDCGPKPEPEPESGPEPEQAQPDPEPEIVGFGASFEVGPSTPKLRTRFNPCLLSPKMKSAKPTYTESNTEASSFFTTPTVVKTKPVDLALMFQDHELPVWPIERNNYASSFPNSIFLSNFMAQKQTPTSSSMNFEDCGALMSWTRLQENMTLGPSLTVVSMKKIWQEIPNSYSRRELAR
jgi:RNA-binding, Nab2-type zinc finger